MPMFRREWQAQNLSADWQLDELYMQLLEKHPHSSKLGGCRGMVRLLRRQRADASNRRALSQ
jgi:hypothetical protein